MVGIDRKMDKRIGGFVMNFMSMMTNELPFMLELPDGIYKVKTTTEVVDIDINSNMYNLYVARFPEFSDKQRYVGEKEELQNIVTNKNLPNYAFGECKTFVSMRCYIERIFSEEDFKSVSTEQCIEKIKSNMIRQKVNYSDTEDLALNISMVNDARRYQICRYLQ